MACRCGEYSHTSSKAGAFRHSGPRAVSQHAAFWFPALLRRSSSRSIHCAPGVSAIPTRRALSDPKLRLRVNPLELRARHRLKSLFSSWGYFNTHVTHPSNKIGLAQTSEKRRTSEPLRSVDGVDELDERSRLRGTDPVWAGRTAAARHSASNASLCDGALARDASLQSKRHRSKVVVERDADKARMRVENFRVLA